jgi:hypothetical protein
VQRTVVSPAVSAFVASCSLVLLLSWEVLGEPKPARAQTTGTCPNAQLIDTFEGNGDQQTDTFDTTTNSLRVTFNVTGSDPDFPASLYIRVVDANDPDQFSVGNATQDGNGRGETFVNSPAGTYYLDISFFDVDGGGQYTITVEQCEGGTPSRNPNPGSGGAVPVRDQYASKTLPPRTPPGDVSNPRDVIPRSSVRRMPPTGGPPYLSVGAVVLLGVALIAGRGALRR